MVLTIRIKLLVAILLLFSIGINAQSLKGRLFDPSNNRPLRRASVNLTSLKDSTQKFNIISDSSGRFEFKNLYTDSFALRISFVGYADFTQIVGINNGTLDLGTLFIPKSIKQLGEVVVVSKVPPVQQKGDTLEYNASQFKVNPDATAEDMVKKLPGVTVDKQGTVTAQGEPVRKVTIDGRDFFGDDATATLRNLPSEIIDKIQVFDRLSDQAQLTGFDDGNTTKSININQQNFSSQDLLGVTGTQNRGGGGNRGGGSNGANFRGGGNNSNFLVGQQDGISNTNSFGINYSDLWGKKIDVSASYFFNSSNTANNETINQQNFITKDSTQFYDENTISKNINYNNRASLRLNYRIDSSNSILFTSSLNFQNDKSNSDVNGVQYIDQQNLL